MKAKLQRPALLIAGFPLPHSDGDLADLAAGAVIEVIFPAQIQLAGAYHLAAPRAHALFGAFFGRDVRKAIVLIQECYEAKMSWRPGDLSGGQKSWLSS